MAGKKGANCPCKTLKAFGLKLVSMEGGIMKVSQNQWMERNRGSD